MSAPVSHSSYKILVLLSLIFIFFSACESCKKQGYDITKFASLASEQEVALFKSSLPIREFSDALKKECTLNRLSDSYTVSVCASSFYDRSNTKATISVYNSLKKQKILETQIDLERYASSDLDIAVDINNRHLCIAWVSQNTEQKNPSRVHLRYIDLQDKTVLFDGVVYEQPWGIARLTMAAHPKSELIVFAYNDFSKRDSEYLYFASLESSLLKNQLVYIEPRPIHTQDKWEKAFPHFWKTKNKLYLYHSTGDTWGLLAYRGKPAVGISELDASGAIENYSIISEETALNNEIRIWDGVVFYEKVTGKNRGFYELKKIDLERTYKPFKGKRQSS